MLDTESSYLNSRVMMLYCCTIMLYHSVILLYLLYGDFDIRSLKKTISADLKYILHIMNYFSQYFMTYLSITVNASDVI